MGCLPSSHNIIYDTLKYIINLVLMIAGLFPSVNTPDSFTTSCAGTNVLARYILLYLATMTPDGSNTGQELYNLLTSLFSIEPTAVYKHVQYSS